LYQRLSLLYIKNFDACLDHSATMLVRRVLKHARPNILKDNVFVFSFDVWNQQYFLDYVIAETIKHQLLKFDLRVFKD